MAPFREWRAKAISSAAAVSESPAANADGAAPTRSTGTCLLGQLRKTKLCLYHCKGACHYGAQCAFAHSGEELRESPDLSNTRLCVGFQETGKCTDKNCKFAHGEDELRSTDLFYRKTLCFWNEKGKCRNGDQCRFAHGREQLRPQPSKPSQNSDPPPPPLQTREGRRLAERKPRGEARRAANTPQEQKQQLPRSAAAPAVSPPADGRRPDRPYRTPLSGLSRGAAALFQSQDEQPRKVYPFAGADQHPAASRVGMERPNSAEALNEKLEMLCHQLTFLTEQCNLVSEKDAGSFGGAQLDGKAAGMSSLFALSHSGCGSTEGCLDLDLTALASHEEAEQEDLWIFGECPHSSTNSTSLSSDPGQLSL